MPEDKDGQSAQTADPKEQATPATIEQLEESLKSEPEVIPEKFAGKPAYEVIRAYKELESKLGSIASEKAQEKQRAELLEQRLRELETRSAYQEPVRKQVEPEKDPLAILDSPEWEKDPRAAIKESFKVMQAKQLQERYALQSQQQHADMVSYYTKQKTENPDFARREANMQQLATQLAAVVKPEFFNSVQVLKALDLMSKGMDIQYYEGQAVERAKKDGLSRVSEKRNAHSESSGQSIQTGGKRPKDMSLKELEALLESSSEQDE